MRDDTKRVHDALVAIGLRVGLQAAREACLELEGEAHDYAPRLDVLWSLPLTSEQLGALDSVNARPPQRRGALPIAAWEVEGSDASTKGMQANLANMRVFGAYLGFLAVRADTKDNLFERALRLASTQSHYFGNRRSIVLDLAWIHDLASMNLSTNASHDTKARNRKASGGTGGWAKSVTSELTDRALRAGFVPIPEFEADRGGDFTKSKIDLVWALPLPGSLGRLVQEIRRRGEVPQWKDCACLPVVGFEIENDGGKHGHGGLLNLASHAMSGVFIPGTRGAAKVAEAAKVTYLRAFPMHTVTIHEEFIR